MMFILSEEEEKREEATMVGYMGQGREEEGEDRGRSARGSSWRLDVRLKEKK